jgi:transcriptional regulator with XRE-family HTH domain
VPISSGHSLILENICFTVKNNQKLTFLSGKNLRENGTGRKTIFAMASDTITKGLKNYAIGSKLRRLRLRKSMGLVELGKHTGLSPALLSKLERDVMHPTLPTLLRIAMVFSVGLEYFFTPEPKPVLEIVRKKDRLRFPDSPDNRKEPGLPGAQPRAEFVPGRIRADRRRKNPAPRTPWDRIAVRSVREAGTAHRSRQIRAFGRRFDLLRFHCVAWLPQTGVQAHNSARGDGEPAGVEVILVQRANRGGDTDPNSTVSFFDAIEAQLGLKLEKHKRPIPVLVIDHIEEKPTDN